jgi:hypothetical protein
MKIVSRPESNFLFAINKHVTSDRMLGKQKKYWCQFQTKKILGDGI